MARQMSGLVVIASIFLVLAPAAAQDAPPEPTDEQREIIQNMRAIAREVGENMRDKGMDPQEFMADVRQQMMDGTFDMAEVQKQLVAKGVMDQEMVDELRGSTQRLIAGGIKQRLGVTDEEWAVLAPRIRRVVVAMTEAGESRSLAGGRAGGFMLMGSGTGESARAMNELRAALNNKATPPQTIVEKLQKLRDVREKARQELAAARDDLRSILTARQEAILLTLGLL
jgi:hypothetical protein